jgi:site-specific DNA-methyltransferase (adenine-specific)
MPEGQIPTEKIARAVEFFTPARILDPVRRYFLRATTIVEIELDPATTSDNPVGASSFFTRAENGLDRDWTVARTVFVNPPYGSDLRDWLAKIHEEASRGAHIVALLPGQRFEQSYFQEHVFCCRLSALCMVRKRVSFLDADRKPQKSNPYGSFLFLYNGWAEVFAEELVDVGMTIQPLMFGKQESGHDKRAKQND